MYKKPKKIKQKKNMKKNQIKFKKQQQQKQQQQQPQLQLKQWMVEAWTERVCMDCGKYMPFVAVHSGAMQQVSVNHKKVWMQPKKQQKK